ncbi:MAG: hypothetical protein DME65_03840 [Verrucomicrobia bacterium]|nr:MAG: hypothetical protein DME65_03840 [Verrucomicrobiota bacterium]
MQDPSWGEIPSGGTGDGNLCRWRIAQERRGGAIARSVYRPGINETFGENQWIARLSQWLYASTNF